MHYPEYQQDVAFCRQIHKKYGKTFYLGSLLLSPREREATWILYAFFRFPDEYVDTEHVDEKGTALIKLARYGELWEKACAGEVFEAEEDLMCVLRAAAHIHKEFSIPIEYSKAFLTAMAQDTHKDRYQTYTELEEYMYGSASVVGIMMTYVICASDPRFASDASYRETIIEEAKTLGEAFQMTNFLRDVGEDMRERGRIYLPQEDMARFGVTDRDIETARIRDAFVLLMQYEINRTRALYVKADAGIEKLPRRAGRGIRMARVLYAEILVKIERAGYDVFSQRAHLSLLEKLWKSSKELF